MIDRISRLLSGLSPIVRDGCIDLTLPLVIHTNGELLELRITPKEDDFVISSITDVFCDANESASAYFDAFLKHDFGYSYDIGIGDDELFFKKYSADFNVITAIDEFLRFFIALDDFIISNDVIGHEEDFIS